MPVEGKGKVQVVHWNLLFPFVRNVEDSENEKSLQNLNGPSNCIQAVPDDVETETKIVSKDPEPEGKCDAVSIQCVQIIYELSYQVNTIWRWVKSLFWHQ